MFLIGEFIPNSMSVFPSNNCCLICQIYQVRQFGLDLSWVLPPCLSFSLGLRASHPSQIDEFSDSVKDNCKKSGETLKKTPTIGLWSHIATKTLHTHTHTHTHKIVSRCSKGQWDVICVDCGDDRSLTVLLQTEVSNWFILSYANCISLKLI